MSDRLDKVGDGRAKESADRGGAEHLIAARRRAGRAGGRRRSRWWIKSTKSRGRKGPLQREEYMVLEESGGRAVGTAGAAARGPPDDRAHAA